MRTRQEIDQEYTAVATAYGDRLFKQTLLQEDIKNLFTRMAQLNQEAALPPLPLTEIDSETLVCSGKTKEEISAITEDGLEDSKVEQNRL